MASYGVRIRYWSSDVSSSDLPCPLGLIAVLSAWLFWKANCDGAAGAVAAMEAQRLNDPLSNKKRAGEAGSSWGCRVGGSLKRSGAAEGREPAGRSPKRSAEHTSELQSIMRISYAVFCLKKKT